MFSSRERERHHTCYSVDICDMFSARCPFRISDEHYTSNTDESQLNKPGEKVSESGASPSPPAESVVTADYQASSGPPNESNDHQSSDAVIDTGVPESAKLKRDGTPNVTSYVMLLAARVHIHYMQGGSHGEGGQVPSQIPTPPPKKVCLIWNKWTKEVLCPK